MKSDFDNKQPIYQQIMDRIVVSIAKGELGLGAKIASVRELALEFNVNPNTMQKSLGKLEDMGLLYTERKSGRYVTQNRQLVEALSAQIPNKILENFVTEMVDFGIELQEIPGRVSDYIERMG